MRAEPSLPCHQRQRAGQRCLALAQDTLPHCVVGVDDRRAAPRINYENWILDWQYGGAASPHPPPLVATQCTAAKNPMCPT